MHPERGAGLLLQWDCNSSGSKVVLVPLDVTEVFADTLCSVQWTVLLVSAMHFTLYTPLAVWVTHLCFTMVLWWIKRISFSGLSPCIYSVKLYMLILISPQILFPVTFNRHRVNALHITFTLLAHFVGNCIFLTFPSQSYSHKNNWGSASYVTGEDPEFCFLLLKLSKLISWFRSNADFAPIFSAFCMLLVYMITY